MRLGVGHDLHDVTFGAVLWFPTLHLLPLSVTCLTITHQMFGTQ